MSLPPRPDPDQPRPPTRTATAHIILDLHPRPPLPPAHRGPRGAHEDPDHPHHALVREALELKATTTMTWEAIAERLQVAPGKSSQEQARRLRHWRRAYERCFGRQ